MATAGERRTRPVSATIGLVFAGLWCHGGAAGLPDRLSLPVEGLGLLVTIALIAVLWTRRGVAGAGGRRFGRWSYLLAVVLEVAAIYAVSVMLARYGLNDYLIPAVGVIVGLHFIGLWHATRQTTFLWIAGCMCAVSAFAAFLPTAWHGFDPRVAVTGLGNALVLWIGAGPKRTPRRPSP